VTMTDLHPGKGYLVRAEYTRNCVLREDKGPEDASSLEQILQTADLTQKTIIHSESPKQLQLSLFEASTASAARERALREEKRPEEAKSFEQVFHATDLTLNTKISSEQSKQLQLKLFEE